MKRPKRVQDCAGYCTSFCNFGHDLNTGVPMEHECFILPPYSLALEVVGAFAEAQEAIQKAKPLQVHPGVRLVLCKPSKHKWEWVPSRYKKLSKRELEKHTGWRMCSECGLESCFHKWELYPEWAQYPCPHCGESKE